MRPIKFRGQAEDGKWVYGDLIQSSSGIKIREEVFIPSNWNVCGGDLEEIEHSVNIQTVGQFSGLYDATKWEELTEQEREGLVEKEWKGRPIYEGDILSFTTRKEWGFQEDGKTVYMLVVFGDSNMFESDICGYIGFWAEHGCGQRDSIIWHVESHQAKVIGNIYDNKELMYKEG